MYKKTVKRNTITYFLAKVLHQLLHKWNILSLIRYLYCLLKWYTSSDIEDEQGPRPEEVRPKLFQIVF